MSYIPKSAQRRIDKANAAIAKLPHRVFDGVEKIAVPFTPNILQAGTAGAGQWDVFLDGVKQHLASYVDVEGGWLRRYTKGVGNKPTTRDTEKVFGFVEVKKRQNR